MNSYKRFSWIGENMAKEKKQEYIELKGILGNAEDYHVYHMTKKDYTISYALGFTIGMVIVYTFFRTVSLAVVVGVVLAWKAPVFYNQYKKENRLKQLRAQFKDLLESLTSSYSTGQNTPNAFADAKNDMISIYGEDGDIVKELQIICAGLLNNINIEQLLLDFAARCELDDVLSFANVFEVCNRQGSDLKKIVSDTREIINDKIEIEMEIDTILAGNKNELNVMMVMPLVIVLSLSSMGSMTIVENTPINVIVKFICLGIFAVAYIIGRKIVDIKI